jgi:hypothetical protein
MMTTTQINHRRRAGISKEIEKTKENARSDATLTGAQKEEKRVIAEAASETAEESPTEQRRTNVTAIAEMNEL